MVREPCDDAFFQGALDGVSDRQTGFFIDDIENSHQFLADRVGGGSSCERAGRRVHKDHPPGRVRGDDGIADTGQGDLEPALLLGQFFFSRDPPLDFPIELIDLLRQDRELVGDRSRREAEQNERRSAVSSRRQQRTLGTIWRAFPAHRLRLDKETAQSELSASRAQAQ